MATSGCGTSEVCPTALAEEVGGPGALIMSDALALIVFSASSSLLEAGGSSKKRTKNIASMAIHRIIMKACGTVKKIYSCTNSHHKHSNCF